VDAGAVGAPVLRDEVRARENGDDERRLCRSRRRTVGSVVDDDSDI